MNVGLIRQIDINNKIKCIIFQENLFLVSTVKYYRLQERKYLRLAHALAAKALSAKVHDEFVAYRPSCSAKINFAYPEKCQ